MPDRRRIRDLSRAYVVLQVLLLVNQGLFAVGLPALSTRTAIPGYPLGTTTGLVVGGLVSAAYLVFAARGTTYRRPTRYLLVASLGLTVPGLLSAMVAGDGTASRQLSLVLISVAIVVASSLAGSGFLLRLLFIAGGIWGWLSILLGLATVSGAMSISALEIDTTGRYREWLGGVIPSSIENMGALTGLAVGRQPLGAATALLLVLQVGLLLAMRGRIQTSPRWYYWSTAGVAGSLIWSLSRTGLTAAVVGLLVLAGARYISSARSLRTLTIAGSFGLVLLPLVGIFFRSAAAPQTTVEWRLELWRAYLRSDATYTYFGAGPSSQAPLGAGHAHNLLMEMLGTAGLLGLLGFVTAVFGAATAISITRPELRGLAAATWLAFVTSGQFEVPYTPRSFAIPAAWFIMLVALAGISSLKPHRSDGAGEGLPRPATEAAGLAKRSNDATGDGR